MTITQTFVPILDSNTHTVDVLSLTDGTNTSPAHAVTNTAMVVIDPATSELQTTGNTSLATIASQTASAATAALQTTGNTSLTTIATNSANHSTSALQTAGNTSLATIATNSGTQATASLQTTGNTSLATIATNTPAKGAAVTAASTPVNIASDQVVPTSNAASSAGGVSSYFNVNLSASPVNVTTVAASLYGYNVYNSGVVPVFVQFFDVSGSVTPGTTPPKMSIFVPAAGALDTAYSGEGKIAFTNKLTLIATTGATNGTSPAADSVVSNIFYK